MKQKQMWVVGSVEFTALFEDRIPRLSVEEYARLKEDIAAHGVLVPVAVDEKMQVIDGINRIKAASELEHRSIPIHVHAGVTANEKKELAIRLNAFRRHWSQDERLAMTVALRREKYSLRRIGKLLNLSHETIRRYLEASGVAKDLPDTVVGDDGIERPAKVTRRPVIALKNTKEAKEAYRQLEEAEGIHLPNSIIDVKRLGRLVRDHKSKTYNRADLSDRTVGQATLLLGDFAEKGETVAPDSVDLIFTDPPYGGDCLGLWDELGRFAEKVLKPGGLLLSYSGVLYLPQIYEMLGRHLKYFWTFAVRHTGGRKTVYSVNVHQAWKPIVGFFKPPFKKQWHTFPDMTTAGQSKECHKWEQPIGEAHYFIQNLCPTKGVLVDPMMGSGTAVLAGMALGMTCTGIEIDTTAFATANQRIEQVQKKVGKEAA